LPLAEEALKTWRVRSGRFLPGPLLTKFAEVPKWIEELRLSLLNGPILGPDTGDDPTGEADHPDLEDQRTGGE
jgi:hypothetical protein